MGCGIEGLQKASQLACIDYPSSVGLNGKLPFSSTKYAEINSDKHANKQPATIIIDAARNVDACRIQRSPAVSPGEDTQVASCLGCSSPWKVQSYRQGSQAPPTCQSINPLQSDFALNKEPSGIDFLSQKSILPERDCADQSTSGFLSAGQTHLGVN